MSSRKATVERNTKETRISVSVDLDGTGEVALLLSVEDGVVADIAEITTEGRP